jgi:hypothetical protein
MLSTYVIGLLTQWIPCYLYRLIEPVPQDLVQQIELIINVGKNKSIFTTSQYALTLEFKT